MTDIYITAFCPTCDALTSHYALADREAECITCQTVSRREPGDWVSWRLESFAPMGENP